VIAMLEVTDPAVYERFKATSPPTIAAAGGRYVGGGSVHALDSEDARKQANSGLVDAPMPESRAARRPFPGQRRPRMSVLMERAVGVTLAVAVAMEIVLGIAAEVFLFW
jgi:uncharacterized protein (DUF1330 family)